MNYFLTGTLLLAVAPLSAAWQRSQTPQSPQVTVEVEAVNVLVTVMDENGRFITDLPRDSFIVYEDGQVQQITNFSQETNLPLRIGLLVDTSASVRLKLDFEKEAARHFLFTVMRGQDRALLVEFDRGATLIQDYTARPAIIAEELGKLTAGGGTALFDAIYLVARDKMSDPNVRKIIVVLSDGEDLTSHHTIEETIEAVTLSELILYAIGTNNFGASNDYRGADILKELADQTGGQAFFPYSPELLTEAFESIGRELRSQYSITYTPINKKRDGTFRKIKINVKGPKGLTTRYKSGYWAGQPRNPSN